MDIDDALKEVGGYRRGSVALFVMLGLSSFIPLVFQALAIVFIGWIPPHHCKVNTSTSLNSSIPYLDDGKLDSCHAYVNSSWSDETRQCTDGWEYYSEGYTTIVTEFDLVCDRDYLVELSQGIQQTGGIVSEVFGSMIVDRFGRRLTHIIAQVIMALLGFGYLFAPNYVTFVSFRILASVCLVTCTSAGVTLMLEIFDASRRTVIGVGLEFFWVVAYSILPLLAWLIQDWRILLSVSSFSSLIWLVYIWILPESPAWLAANERYEEAEAALQHLGRLNGVSEAKRIRVNRDVTPVTPGVALMGSALSLHEETKNRNNSSKPKSDRVLDLILDPKLRLHLLASGVMWFSNILMFYGLTLSTSYLGNNRFLDFFYLGLVEIPAYAITLFIIGIKWLGRKRSLILFHVLSGVAFGILAAIPFIVEDDELQQQLKLAMALLAKFFSSCTFGIIVLYSRELFPASLRGTSMGMYVALGRIGDILAPAISYLARQTFWLPNLILGVLSLLTVLPILPLPETLKKPLPLTTEDVYKIYYGGRSGPLQML